MMTLLLASALIAGLFSSAAAVPLPAPFPFPVPYHAFCRTLWILATPCAEISTTFAQEIQMSGPQYELVSATPLSIIAIHTSPDGIQAQNVTLTLISTVLTGGCQVSAQSTSLGFTSLVDGGLNYCVLYNLLSATGLSSAPGFMEMTTEWACLGYGLSICKA